MIRHQLLICLLVRVSATWATIPKNCSHETKNISVYYGWPVALDCQTLVKKTFRRVKKLLTDGKLAKCRCIIYDNFTGSPLLNATTTYRHGDDYSAMPKRKDFIHKIYDVNNSTSTTYDFVVTYELTNTSSTFCYSQTGNLNAGYLPQPSCDEAVKSDVSEPGPTEKEVGAVLHADCDIEDGLQDFVDEAGLELHWLYNCAEGKLPDNVEVDSEKHGLTLTNVSYETTPGVYTCAAKYGGQTRYRHHHKICVKDQASQEITLRCNNSKAVLGQDVEIKCDVDAGLGHTQYHVFRSRFDKLDGNGEIDSAHENSSCVAHAEYDGRTSVDKRFSCNLTLQKIGECHIMPTTAEERSEQRTKLNIYYKIRSVQTSDFGEYVVTLYRAQHQYDTTFRVEKDLGPGLEQWTFILICCLAGAGCLLLVLLILFLFRLHLRVVWKRKFGAMEKGIKPYAAYLAYYYNEDMSQKAINDLDSFVESLESRLKRLGGKFYDKCRENHSQYVAANIQAKLAECHRVIIILTPEYIQDQWSVYETYEAWKNVIEFGIPIIFVVFPSTKSAIDGLAAESKTALTKAIKRHSVMKWNGKLPFAKRLKMKLEILMPKLPRGGDMEMGAANSVH